MQPVKKFHLQSHPMIFLPVPKLVGMGQRLQPLLSLRTHTTYSETGRFVNIFKVSVITIVYLNAIFYTNNVISVEINDEI